MIERCGDRQRKCDGLETWRLHLFIESLPLMLQASLLLLACGLCRNMWSVNASVAYTLIGLTGLGVAFFAAIVIAGASSYACPFQTPASTALRSTWKRVRRGALFPGDQFKRAFSRSVRASKRRVRSLLRRPSLPVVIPLWDVQIQEHKPWLKPKDLATIGTTNTNDVGCVSWILWNITDPEALDAAVRLAGTIRWFDDGTNVELPYDLIVTTFEACFDPAGKLYPGSRDRAYYSGRVMVWIHTFARCKSEEFALRFPLSSAKHEEAGLDPDLGHLLRLNQVGWSDEQHIAQLLTIGPEHTPSHTQWISDVLLRRSWATWSEIDCQVILGWISDAPEAKITICLSVTLNRLLVWCIFLGSPPVEEALKVQNKSYGASWSVLQITHSTLR